MYDIKCHEWHYLIVMIWISYYECHMISYDHTVNDMIWICYNVRHVIPCHDGLYTLRIRLVLHTLTPVSTAVLPLTLALSCLRATSPIFRLLCIVFFCLPSHVILPYCHALSFFIIRHFLLFMLRALSLQLLLDEKYWRLVTSRRWLGAPSCPSAKLESFLTPYSYALGRKSYFLLYALPFRHFLSSSWQISIAFVL